MVSAALQGGGRAGFVHACKTVPAWAWRKEGENIPSQETQGKSDKQPPSPALRSER